MGEIIFNLHGLGDPPTTPSAGELKYWLNEAAFDQLLDEVCLARDMDDMCISITFDDGNMSDALIALPALVSRGLTAHFFLCAARVGKPHYLDGVAIRELLAAGMTIGSHGMNHIDWRRTSDSELDEEISGARRKLEDVCSQQILEVAIPFGSYDRRSISRLRKENLNAVFTSDGGVVRSGSWQKARNSLDRTRQHKGIIGEIRLRDNLVRRARRNLLTLYKSLR